MTERRPLVPKPSAGLRPPAGLRAACLEHEGRAIWVMSYELPEWELPAALTATERAVVLASLGGATQRQIATSRGVSPRTVANQLAAAYGKLGVSSRIELAAKLRRVRKPSQGR